MPQKSIYEALGASATKASLHRAIKQAGLEDSGTFFAKLNKDFAGDPNYYSFIHCDGAGTKTIPAYLMYKETGDPTYFKHLAEDALVMNLDDIYCVGKPESLLLSNTIARNLKLIPAEVIETLIISYKHLVDKYNALDIPLELSGGETADCGDVVRTIMVDAVVAGRIKKSQTISPDNIAAGDVIVGLASFGQSSYEQAENSGISSNGMTLARHALLNIEHAKKYPEILASETANEKAYFGNYFITDYVDSLKMKVGEALLSPTRSFAPILSKIYDTLSELPHGVIHCTGGGLTKVLRFGKGKRYIKNDLFDCPPIFSLIKECGDIPKREMNQVFNLGQRLEIYLPEKDAQQVIDIASSFNVQGKIIGYVEDSPTRENSVVIGDNEYTL